MQNGNGGSETPKDSFCILPWMHLHALPSGNQSPCCIADWGKDAEPLYREGGVERAWNGAPMKALRLAMLEGERSPVCSRCYQDEDAGIRSLRQVFNNEFGAQIAEARAATGADGSSPSERICSMDLRLGNVCNLRCRMCAPESSKALIPEWSRMDPQPRSDAQLAELRRLDWFERDEFWHEIDPHVPGLRLLHFTGGEPLLIQRMIAFLRRIVDSGRAGDITLSYVTNLTVLPEPLLELWPRFKGVRLAGSIDGIGELDSFIRHPSQWPVVERNLMRLDNDYAALNLERLMINATVQVYNIFRLDELIEYAVTSVKHLHYFRLNMLFIPEHFSIQVLPPEMKRAAADRLRRFVDRFDGRWPAHWEPRAVAALLDTIEGVIRHMMSVDRSDQLPEFRRWSLYQDRFRDQNLLEIVPELAPLFDVEPAAALTAA